MTLAITLVTSHGVWSSTDHRLTEYPSGKLITDSSTKHVTLRCPDGAALVSYTGLGRVGSLDVSTWTREILRGESRTVDESLIDLREQATARFGLPAYRAGVPHVFLGGAFLGGQSWAIQIHNIVTPNAVSTAGLQPCFGTAAVRADQPVLFVGGSGANAVRQADRDLLQHVSTRRPRRPEDFMRLLGEINQRAAESPAARNTVSRSCTVIFMPPSPEGGKQEWYGPEEERPSGFTGMSHLLFGIDVDEFVKPMMERAQATWDGRIKPDEPHDTKDEAGRAVTPRGRRPPRP